MTRPTLTREGAGVTGRKTAAELREAFEDANEAWQSISLDRLADEWVIGIRRKARDKALDALLTAARDEGREQGLSEAEAECLKVVPVVAGVPVGGTGKLYAARIAALKSRTEGGR